MREDAEICLINALLKVRIIICIVEPAKIGLTRLLLIEVGFDLEGKEG